MLCREVTALYIHIHTKRKYTLCKECEILHKASSAI
jgi:hypothetical protein